MFAGALDGIRVPCLRGWRRTPARADGGSAIGTLVERSIRYTMLAMLLWTPVRNGFDSRQLRSEMPS